MNSDVESVIDKTGLTGSDKHWVASSSARSLPGMVTRLGIQIKFYNNKFVPNKLVRVPELKRFDGSVSTV